MTPEVFFSFLALFFTVPALGEWFLGPKQSIRRGLLLSGLVVFSFYVVSYPSWTLITVALMLVFFTLSLPMRLEKKFLNQFRTADNWEESRIPRILAFLLLEGEQHLYLRLQRLYALLRQGDYERFNTEIQRDETQQKDLGRFYAEVLDLFRMSRRYEEGIVFFEKRQEKIIASEALFFTLCRLYAETGRFKKSHLCLQQLEALPHSEYLQTYILMGYLVFYALAGAKDRFIQLLAEYPRLIEIPFFLHWKAILLIRAGDITEGEPLLKSFHEKNQKPLASSEWQRYLHPLTNSEETGYAREVLWKKIATPTLPVTSKSRFESWFWIGLLSGINVALFFYVLPLNNLDFLNLGALTNLALQGEGFRLISSAFLHGGWLHFLSNLLSIFVLAPPIEVLYRRFQMTTILLVSTLAGNLLSLYENPEVLSIGISGGVCGLFGAFLLYHLSLRKKLPPDLFKRFVFISLILIGLMSYMGYSIPQINNWAHLGGFIAGAILAVVFKQWNQKISERVNFWICGAFITVLFLWSGWGWADLLRNPYPKTPNYQEITTRWTHDGFVFELPRDWTMERVPEEKEANPLNPNEYQIKAPHSFLLHITYNAYPYPLPKNFFENDFQFVREETFQSWTVQYYLYRNPEMPIALLYFSRSYGFRTCNLYYPFNARLYKPEAVKAWIAPILKHITPQ